MTSIERPKFYEGQTLSPAALTECVDYPRGQMARHERLLHTPGILIGLDLALGAADSTGKRTTATVAAGAGIDSSGREVISPAQTVLSIADLASVGVSGTFYYPVFLIGADQEGAPPLVSSACDASQADTIIESASVEFGRPGDAAQPATATPGVTDGPATPGQGILLGYIQSDGAQFLSVSDPPNGVPPAYAGARADEIVARGDQLSLKTPDSAKPAQLLLDENGSLVFGSLDGTGKFTTALTVTSTGDLTAIGVLTGTLTAGGIFVTSGTAFDGVKIPLPPEVTEQQVSSGAVAVHVLLTPRPGSGATADVKGQFCIVNECSIDPVTRQLTCTFDWINLFTPTVATNLTGACDYILIASVPPAKGS